MPNIEAKLGEMGHRLPPPPEPVGNYLAATRSGNIMWMAGVGSRRDDGTRITGKLGTGLTVEQGYEAARWCALNLLARMKAELGDLDKVTHVVKILGMVQSTPDFNQYAQVVNGCSDLLVELYGENGKHARSSMGVPNNPFDGVVSIDAVFEVAD